LRYLLLVLFLCALAHGENLTAATDSLPDAPAQHPFWTVEGKIDFGILGGLVAADAITTQRGLSEGLRETNPVMRPFVTRGIAGQAVGSALGFGAALGTIYLMHQSHHYKAERITRRLTLGVEGAVVGNNIAAIR
jgi:Domain of unknown function (DUF5658)